MNKIAKKFRIMVDLHGFDYTVNELVGMHENINKAIKWHGRVLDNDFLKYKNSETIFILGSGPSINDIKKIEWEHIANKDSVGFNYWIAHNFVPSFYAMQNFDNNIIKILNNKIDKYKKIPFIIRGSSFARDESINSLKNIEIFKYLNVYYVNEYPISSRCSIEINSLFRYMEALGFMTFGKISKFIPKWRSTIGLILMLAYQMGYKNMVLCGIDMTGSDDHFWDYHPYKDIGDMYSLPKKGESNIKDFTDNKISVNTVPSYIYNLNDWFYNYNKVKIFVMSSNSILYPNLDIYKIV